MRYMKAKQVNLDPTNPLVFKDPFLAGAFAATLINFSRMNFAGARHSPITAIIANEDGAFEIHLVRPMKICTYATIIDDVRKWRKQVVEAAPKETS